MPAWGLVLQGVWAAVLVLPRTYDVATRTYGNLYSDLLDYVISAALIFYILTIAGVFRLRQTRPNADRPYRAFGYPVVPALYIVGAATILLVLFVYRARRRGLAWSSCCSACRSISRGGPNPRCRSGLSGRTTSAALKRRPRTREIDGLFDHPHGRLGEREASQIVVAAHVASAASVAQHQRAPDRTHK